GARTAGPRLDMGNAPSRRHGDGVRRSDVSQQNRPPSLCQHPGRRPTGLPNVARSLAGMRSSAPIAFRARGKGKTDKLGSKSRSGSFSNCCTKLLKMGRSRCRMEKLETQQVSGPIGDRGDCLRRRKIKKRGRGGGWVGGGATDRTAGSSFKPDSTSVGGIPSE